MDKRRDRESNIELLRILAMFGVIIDETVPNYFLVKFANDDVQWIDGKYLTVIKTDVK